MKSTEKCETLVEEGSRKSQRDRRWQMEGGSREQGRKATAAENLRRNMGQW